MELIIYFRTGEELRVNVTPDVATSIRQSALMPESLIAVYQSSGRLLCFRYADVLYIR